jgi:periplasmic protein TonB
MKPIAMLLTVILLITGTLFIGGSFTTKKKGGTAEHGSELTLPEVSLKKEKAAPSPQTDYKKATPPKATILKLIKPQIDTIVVEGESTHCGVMPPPLPEEDNSESILMCNVAMEAEYPGGTAAWQRYLVKNLRYPEDALDNEIPGSVMVQFVVDEEGNVSEVEAVSGSAAWSAEAVRVIKKSGKWTPARQVGNGRYVKSIKRQPFIICLEEE